MLFILKVEKDTLQSCQNNMIKWLNKVDKMELKGHFKCI